MIPMTDPHLRSPRALAPGNDFAPALVIYHDIDAVISVSNTQIVITIGSSTLTITYPGKTLQQVAAEISVSSEVVKANALNVVYQLPAGYLYFDGELAPDGGKVIRMRGHAVKYQEETRIRGLLPYSEHRFRPWYPRLDRGKIKVKRQGVDYTFGIPEYAEQEWSTYFGAPFVDVSSERASTVAPKIIRLARTPVFWYRQNISIEINGIFMGASIVADVDEHNGFVKLTVPVTESDRILVNYVYREETLIYKDVNLNPSINQNPAVIDQIVLLYLLPESDSLGRKRSKTVYHKLSKTITGAISSIGDSAEPILIVGAYQVRPTAVLADIKLTDSRSEGGGIKEDEIQAAIAENVEIRSFADIGQYDGIPFPGAAGGVLRLHRSVVNNLGQELVELLAKKHLAAGGVIVLDPVDSL